MYGHMNVKACRANFNALNNPSVYLYMYALMTLINCLKMIKIDQNVSEL